MVAGTGPLSAMRIPLGSLMSSRSLLLASRADNEADVVRTIKKVADATMTLFITGLQASPCQRWYPQCPIRPSILRGGHAQSTVIAPAAIATIRSSATTDIRG
jgi:hypothetical protein